jgi:opacity protein-like surface antigen
MRSLTTNISLAVAATFGLAALSGAVRAADMPVEYPPVIEAPEPMPLPAVGGWYLRGDIGYKYYNAPKGSMSNGRYGGYDTNADSIPDTYPYASGGHNQLVNEKMLGAADFGVGVGYKFNDYLRTDLVLDYETPAKFRGSLWCQTTPCGGGGYFDSERVKISAWSGLVNVYADLGNFHGIIPYIGAGAGASYLKTSSVVSSNQNSTGPKYPSGDGKWNFAWALMAGVEYPISDRLSLDLGYRYLNLGDAQTGYVTDSYGQSTRMDYKDITAHEVRVGLRYYLN